MTRISAIARRLVPWLVASVICLVSGELVARFDDWTFDDIPFLANPDREHDLLLRDADCLRGRPGGKFKKYHLNDFGFRGPPMTMEKSPHVKRVLVLGASESFGLYESQGHEYPELLRQTLHKEGDNVEVVNAAVAGMTLPTLTDYWTHWVKRFGPDVVLIYPSPQFYLDNEPPKAVTPKPESETRRAAPFHSRLYERFRDTAKQSDMIKSLRVHYLLAKETAGKDAAWFFRDVPADRLKQFRDDLEKLAVAVQASGATPVLVTHAFKSPSPPEEQDLKLLNAFRIFFPRAEPAVMPAFDEAARQATIELGREHGWPVIDAAGELNGKRELFADPVHFNDKGAKALANRLTHDLQPILRDAKGGS